METEGGERKTEGMRWKAKDETERGKMRGNVCGSRGRVMKVMQR